MIDKALLISFSLQILFFLLFFSTALARLPEPIPTGFSFLIAFIGLIVSVISIIKGNRFKFALTVLGISLLIFLMVVYAIFLSGM